MPDDLGHPASKDLEAGLELIALVLYFDMVPALGFLGADECESIVEAKKIKTSEI